jgi:predicted DNA-binding transcriptional regulator AlpA
MKKTWLRFADLKARGIVNSQMTLWRMVKNEGFPAGVLLTPNVRAYREDLVDAWLEGRPTASKTSVRQGRC